MGSLDRASPWPFVGMVGIACTAFLIGASVLIAPWYVVAGLAVVWVITLLAAIRWWTPHPNRLPWLAVGTALVWFAVVFAHASLSGG